MSSQSSAERLWAVVRSDSGIPGGYRIVSATPLEKVAYTTAQWRGPRFSVMRLSEVYALRTKALDEMAKEGSS